MAPLPNIFDPEKGRKTFEDAFGHKFGPKAYRATLIFLLPLAVAAIAIFFFSEIGVKDWFFSTSKEVAQAPSVPSKAAPHIGSDNTIVNAPIPPNTGSGNTIVGPTDSNGNSIYRGGTGIGVDTCTDPSSVVIGARARSNACPPPK